MLSEDKKVGLVASELMELAEGVEHAFSATDKAWYIGKLFKEKIISLASELVDLEGNKKKGNTQKHCPIL